MFRRALAAGAALALAACSQIVPEPEDSGPPPVLVGETAAQSFILRGPSLASLAPSEADAAAALEAFRTSCPAIRNRADASGLTQLADWAQPCDAASAWRGSAAAFFGQYFTPVRIADGAAFATGYFEPQIAGSRYPLPGYAEPVYGMPDDLVRGWPADVPEAERTGRAPLGRYDESGAFVRYYDRAEIEEGALAGRGLEIGWAADAIEFFFLQIQGSGQLIAPDGSVMRIGYAGQNGRGYTGIGSVMRERGLLGDGPGQYAGSMQGIVQYLRDNPEDGRELMRLNQSWIFFRELTGDGPIGSIGVPVRRESSVAVDPKFVPYGAPVWLDLDRDVADGLWVAQDTGGAIRGANRFDTFWGAGGDAPEIAGGMSGRGQALVLLPNASTERLFAR